MILYHGTQDSNLKELRTDFHSGRKNDSENIYLTDSFACAFMYAGCVLRCFEYDKKNDVLWLLEKAPNAFEKMYKGHSCYIYSINVEDAVKVNHITNHVYVCKHNIFLDKNNCEYIPDCYEKLLQLEKDGILKLQRWNNWSKEQQHNIKEKFIKQFTPYMEENKKSFPESYKILVNLYPELAVKEKH